MKNIGSQGEESETSPTLTELDLRRLTVDFFSSPSNDENRSQGLQNADNPKLKELVSSIVWTKRMARKCQKYQVLWMKRIRANEDEVAMLTTRLADWTMPEDRRREFAELLTKAKTNLEVAWLVSGRNCHELEWLATREINLRAEIAGMGCVCDPVAMRPLKSRTSQKTMTKKKGKLRKSFWIALDNE